MNILNNSDEIRKYLDEGYIIKIDTLEIYKGKDNRYYIKILNIEYDLFLYQIIFFLKICSKELCVHKDIDNKLIIIYNNK